MKRFWRQDHQEGKTVAAAPPARRNYFSVLICCCRHKEQTLRTISPLFKLRRALLLMVSTDLIAPSSACTNLNVEMRCTPKKMTKTRAPRDPLSGHGRAPITAQVSSWRPSRASSIDLRASLPPALLKSNKASALNNLKSTHKYGTIFLKTIIKSLMAYTISSPSTDTEGGN